MRNRQNVKLEKALLNAQKVMESLREQMKITESAIREIERHLVTSKPIAKVRLGPEQTVRPVKEERAVYPGLLRNQRSYDNHEKLRKLRGFKVAFGLTNRELAEVVGVSERTIFNWMSGEALLNRLAREKIDKLFRVHEKGSNEIKPEARRRWLFAQNELLGDSAYNLLAKGEFEKVLADIEAMREGVHV